MVDYDFLIHDSVRGVRHLERSGWIAVLLEHEPVWRRAFEGTLELSHPIRTDLLELVKDDRPNLTIMLLA